MENVAYDVPKLYPPQPRNHVWGECVNTGSRLCLDTMSHPVPGSLGVSGCHGFGGNQVNRFKLVFLIIKMNFLNRCFGSTLKVS